MHAMSLEPNGRYATAALMLADMDEFRKNPGILFDYQIPGLSDQAKQRKVPLVLDTDPITITTQTEETKQSNDVPPVVVPPKKDGHSVGNGNRNGKSRGQNANRQRKRKTEKESNIATVAIIACSVLMVLAVVIFLIVLLGSGSGSKVEYVDIPQLIGREYDVVKNDSSLGVEIKLGEKKFSTEYPAGQIMDQNPVSGGQIAKGSIIAVDVSLGAEPAPVLMPEILGWEQSEAERAINNLGIKLTIKVQTENHDEIEKGKVIRTEPAAKEQLAENQEIILVVSLGMEYKTAQMLNVVGYTKADAETVLRSQPLKLDLVFEDVFDSTVESGRVVRTDPEADMEIETGETVIVYVSKGPEMKAIPDVLGSKWGDAYKVLKEVEKFNNCLIQRIPSEKEKDTVIELRVDDKKVSPGDKVDINSVITIVVSDGPDAQEGVKKQVEVLFSEDFLPPFMLIIKQGDVLVYEVQIEDDEQEKVTVELVGNGKQIYDVYINNNVYMKLEVDFTT